jgi:hypothetical protein
MLGRLYEADFLNAYGFSEKAQQARLPVEGVFTQDACALSSLEKVFAVQLSMNFPLVHLF